MGARVGARSRQGGGIKKQDRQKASALHARVHGEADDMQQQEALGCLQHLPSCAAAAASDASAAGYRKRFRYSLFLYQ